MEGGLKHGQLFFESSNLETVFFTKRCLFVGAENTPKLKEKMRFSHVVNVRLLFLIAFELDGFCF